MYSSWLSCDWSLDLHLWLLNGFFTVFCFFSPQIFHRRKIYMYEKENQKDLTHLHHRLDHCAAVFDLQHQWYKWLEVVLVWGVVISLTTWVLTEHRWTWVLCISIYLLWCTYKAYIVICGTFKLTTLSNLLWLTCLDLCVCYLQVQLRLLYMTYQGW